MTSSGTALPDWGYEELKVIGRGQYGKAHLVRAEIDDQYYIAKTIDLTCLSSKEQETAYQEVALLRSLDHPNIVSYRDNFFMGDTLVIIMQYCEGGDLATYIKDMRKQRQRIDEQQIMHYFVQILQALQYIHSKRILHRDLKTSNLFLMKSKFVVKLGDFGISRVLEGSIEAAITVVGTPYYMSPEVCENKPYTFKSDVPRDVAKSGRIFLEDDCEPAAAATAAVLEEEPELWIMVNDTSENVVPDSLLAPGAESKETSKGSLAPLVPGEVAAVRRDQRRRLKDGFYGRLECFELQELSPAEAESIHQGLGKDFTRFCRMTMKGPEDYRTIRLEPGIIRCHRAEAWHSGHWKPPVGATWSFNFALAVEKTANCFVNVGLVEWLAARQESEGTVSHDESLAEVLKVKSEAEDNVPGGWLPEQHVHENPKQMMLGCRKGVQWFGNAAKVPLFQDNIMEGSLLRFRCDYHLNRQGDIAQVKIWFLPSPVNFEYGGQHTITEADMWFEPLAQWWEPRCQDRKMRSLWVPAVTMYTCEDVVTVAWND